MTTHTEFLKFSDKIYFNSTHYQGALSLYYVGNQCFPVVEQQKTEFARNFERCIYQVRQSKTLDQQAFLWGEAAETAKYVSYGQVVKLWNVFSNRYLTCDGPATDEAERDDSRMKASMTIGQPSLPVGHPDEMQHEMQLFRILPKYKIREVGERVRLEDQIVIEHVRTELFVHVTSLTTSLTTLWKSHQEQVMEAKGVTTPVQHFVDFQTREQKGAAWQMEPYETDKDKEKKFVSDQCVMAGSAVVLYHREAEGFLLCDWQIQDADHGFIDHHNIQKATFNVLDLPYSSNALWILESEDSKKGGAVLFNKHRKYYRLKHMATGLYLTLNCWSLPDGTRMQDVTTTYLPEDKNTLLAIHPLDTHDQSEALTTSSFARLCFHYEEVWLHATGEYTIDEPVRTCVSVDDQFKAASLGTTGKLQRVETTTKGYYEDVFAIRVVNPEEKESLTQVCNMVVTLERFHQYWIDLRQEREEEKKAVQEQRNLQMQRGLHGGTGKHTEGVVGKDQADTLMMQLKRNTKNQESSKLIQSAMNALKSLCLFCTKSKESDDPFGHNGPPVRKHQRMLFQQNVHNLVFRMLRAPMEHGGLTLEAILRLEQYRNLRNIYALGYRLIKLMVKGAKDMAQQMSQFLSFIESQLGDMTSIADAYMQIICNNDRLLDHLQPLQLESFVWLIPQYGRKSTYMTLLSACCTCDGEGLPNNQQILVRKLRNMEKLRLMYPLRLKNDMIQIRPVSGFPANTERKIRRFKRRKENGEEEEDDGSSDSDSESEEEERIRAPASPYAMRYSPRSRSASPQAALLNVAYNIPAAMNGSWVWTCDVPCVVPRWHRQWLTVTGGSLLLGSNPGDIHPRTVPIYMFQHAKKDGVANKAPPDGLHKQGLTLVFKAPKGLLQDEERRNERRLLVCTENMHDRLDLLVGLRREIKHAANIENDEIDLPDDMVNSATASLSHMRAQMNALLVRNTTTGDVNDTQAGDAEEDLWIALEAWITDSDPEETGYFEQSLIFLAALCMGGNDVAINYVKKRFPPQLILQGIMLQVSHPLCDPIRSGFVKIARYMFVENGLHAKTPKEILDRLKDTVYDFITRNSRLEVSAAAKNNLMTNMLELANVMITSGCYTPEELEHLFHPLLKLLDGTSDSMVADDLFTAYEAPRVNNNWGGTDMISAIPSSPLGSPASPRTEESRKAVTVWSDTGPGMVLKNQRFAWTENNQVVMESKLTCCKILQWLFRNAGTTMNIRKWVDRVSSTDRRIGKHPEGAFLRLKTDLLSQVLLDTTLYKGFPQLFRTALQLVLVNTSGEFGDPTARELENDEKAIKGLAEVLKNDLLNRNRMLTMNLFRHFKESKEDNLTIALLRVFKHMIYLHPSKKEMEKMQFLLDDLGVTPIVTQMIESKDEEVVSESLQFGHALLEGGNHKVQKAVSNYFLSLNDEAFFSCTKDRISRAIQLIKNTESSEKHKTGKSQQPDGNSLLSNLSAQDPNVKYKQCELYQLEKVLRFLQLFCEGHNRELQDYLREQDDNVHTYNLVKETITALKHLLMIEQCDDFVFAHVVQAFNTLTEYCQGPCPANQQALVNANIAFEVNVVLSRPLPLVDEDQRDELKNAALTMLLSVLEGVEENQIPNIMNRTLDFKLIATLLGDVWVRRKEEQALDLGFTAFMLLRTLSTFDEALTDFIERCEGFSFYTALTGRIEILRTNSLVRVYFRIPFICSNLSDKTKDELLWNVNRETPTARIADFFDRAEELIYEIEFYERNFKQPCELEVESWFPSKNERIRQCMYLINSTITWWENGMIVLAFLINSIVCMNYVTNSSGPEIVRKPLEGFHIESDIVIAVLNVLMICQFVVCTFLLFDFCVAKAPLVAHRRKKKV